LSVGKKNTSDCGFRQNAMRISAMKRNIDAQLHTVIVFKK